MASGKSNVFQQKSRHIGRRGARLPSRAYAPYAAGWREADRFTHDSLHRALEALHRAIALDPDFLAA